jgi:uncharacterized heparinase superfamily protein
VQSLMSEWIRANTFANRTCRDAWHPYVVSLRLVNWILAISATGAVPSDVPSEIRESLVVQSLFVSRNLETDVGGNHLLKNLKALVVAGCFFDGAQAEAWRTQMAARFSDALEAQLLDDGGHYERSPMYHALVMGDLVEAVAVLAAREGAVSTRLVTLLRRMDQFLSRVTHPDGEIALFNDSAFGVAPRPAELHACVRLLVEGAADGPVAMRHALVTSGLALPVATSEAGECGARSAGATSGYVIVESQDRLRYLIADTGAVCPDNLPAHAHADLLSYEVSLDGMRIIVDSGVAEYAAGPWRDYDRSTRAHNTVVVDGAEQSDCWASFRVAERARPVDVRTVSEPRIAGFSAAHDGFERLPEPVRHTRRVALVDGLFWLILDELTGTGLHRWESFIHLHPDAEAELVDESTAVARSAHATLHVRWFGGLTAGLVRGSTEPIQGWRAQEFGRRVPATTIQLRGTGHVPVVFGYALVPQTASRFERLDLSIRGERCIVTIGDVRRDVDLAARAWRVTTTNFEGALSDRDVSCA